jgi:hypothetical protein
MPTLTPTTILQTSLNAYRNLFPFVGKMGTDFSTAAPLLKDQTVIAHIRTLPTVSTYDPTTGYANGATESRDLLQDLPIVVDKHELVAIKLSHLNAIADQKRSFVESVEDAAYQLGKSMIDSITTKCRCSNLSYSRTETEANSDIDVIEQLTTDMNVNQASPRGRVGLINSNVAMALATDVRVGSRDYYGQLTGGGGLRMFKGVGGFEALYEYPGLSLNNRATQTFTAATTDICTAVAHGYSTGDRIRVSSTTTLPAGISAATTYFVIRVDANNFKIATTDALATAGTARDITDTGTGTHSVVGFENITGIFWESQAIALRAGIPGASNEIASSFGIPQTMGMESLSDPNSGFALALMKWQQPGTSNLFMATTSIWGSAVGRQAGAASALTDRSAILLRSA